MNCLEKDLEKDLLSNMPLLCRTVYPGPTGQNVLYSLKVWQFNNISEIKSKAVKLLFFIASLFATFLFA